MKHKPLQDADLPRLSPEDAGRLYYCFDILADICALHNISWWLSYASLLGAVRHGGIIPWDDDGDICIDAGSEALFASLRPAFHERGCELVKWWGGYRLSMCQGRLLSRKEGEYDPWPGFFPFIDIFPFGPRKGRITHQRRITRFRWFHMADHFFPDELFPLRNIPFGPLILPTPSLPRGYLDRLYGPSWTDTAYCQHDHFTGKGLKKTPVPLKDFSPAAYIPANPSFHHKGGFSFPPERGKK